MATHEGLARLNALDTQTAESELLKCCGAREWARALVARRPFEDTEELMLTADQVWWSLGTRDWHEAFASHPKIGERKAAQMQSEQAQAWSEQEQSGTRDAEQATLDEL
ncbi:MAG TPA: 2-oxo-4-hydroxy-4-carboxy-5-ureidoimidazoline decarboxylase, partial [Pyrinomonadaceae bacterium]|nr:2-oxo-4-hydroxy-4-carboxy-5-ureidoimidazoline decarboxylase [Pyrinomonadaceae bacterium]